MRFIPDNILALIGSIGGTTIAVLSNVEVKHFLVMCAYSVIGAVIPLSVKWVWKKHVDKNG